MQVIANTVKPLNFANFASDEDWRLVVKLNAHENLNFTLTVTVKLPDSQI